MTVQHILEFKRTGLVSVEEYDVFLTIAQKLDTHNIGVVVVLDGFGGLAGIISERDLVRAFATQSSAALVRSARDLMTGKVQTCSPQDSEIQVIKRMLKLHIRHMPVVSEGKVIGLVSLGDAVLQRLSKLGYMGLDQAAGQPLGAFSQHLSRRGS